MGLFDMLGIGGTKEERETRSLARLQKKVQEKFGPPENRQGAIEELGALRTTGAVEVLLTRFTIRIDPGITDDEEKHRTLDLVVDAGEAALPALKKFIATRDEISWPLQALADLVPEFEVVNVLVETLRKAANEYARVPEKKVLLLHALAHHRSPDAIAAALPFLEDMDDDVVIAAAQAIAAQSRPSESAAPEAASSGANATDNASTNKAGAAAAPGAASSASAIDPAVAQAGREPLILAMLRAHELKNARVVGALASQLADTGWDVKGFTPKVEAALPEGYKLDSKARILRKE